MAPKPLCSTGGIMFKRSNYVSLLWLVLALFAAAPLFAQSTSSALTGRVTDEKGAPIAGVQVEIIHQPSGTHATATTDADGRYQARGLRVGGPYSIKASA